MKVNWLIAKQDYIHDIKLSYVEIAKKYGVVLQTVKDRALKDEWTKARRIYIQKVDQKLTEKSIGQEVDHQARLLRQATFVAGEGLKGIVANKPTNVRESKELWEAGTNLQTKVLGLDKPTNVNNTQINNFIPILGLDIKTE